MSQTNLDIIRDALGYLGILAEDENPSASQAAGGLRAMNDMVSSWLDIDLQYFPQTVLADETPLPDYAVLGVKTGLAIYLAPSYGREPPASVLALFSTFWTQQTKDTVKAQIQPADMSHTNVGDGCWTGGNILTGE